MKRLPLLMLVASVFVLPLDVIDAKENDKSSSKNSSKDSNKSSKGNGDPHVDAAELLARIEALEEAVQALDGGSPDVAGATFLTKSLSSGIAAYSFPGQFQLVGTAERLLSFETASTGSSTPLECHNQQLTYIISNQPTLNTAPGCAGTTSTFTYVQIGSQIEITDDISGNSSTIFVNDSGDSIVGGGQGYFGLNEPPAPFLLTSGNLMVGVKVSPN